MSDWLVIGWISFILKNFYWIVVLWENLYWVKVMVYAWFSDEDFLDRFNELFDVELIVLIVASNC